MNNITFNIRFFRSLYLSEDMLSLPELIESPVSLPQLERLCMRDDLEEPNQSHKRTDEKLYHLVVRTGGKLKHLNLNGSALIGRGFKGLHVQLVNLGRACMIHYF